MDISTKIAFALVCICFQQITEETFKKKLNRIDGIV